MSNQDFALCCPVGRFALHASGIYASQMVGHHSRLGERAFRATQILEVSMSAWFDAALAENLYAHGCTVGMSRTRGVSRLRLVFWPPSPPRAPIRPFTRSHDTRHVHVTCVHISKIAICTQFSRNFPARSPHMLLRQFRWRAHVLHRCNKFRGT